MTRICATAFAVVLALLPRAARGQPVVEAPTAVKRPIVGLVLGGGSARGMAHAGVLQWLEEHQIPVDRIAGNSTGALMSAAYATGMSAREIQTLLKEADWDTILRPDIPYSLKAYRRKEDDRDYAVKIEAGLRQGFRLQSGINPGHHLGLLVSRVLLPYSEVTDFDDLPIPFRCVATDLEKGEIVVFDSGPMAPAVRASMSLPGTYDPVRLNGRLFADGGILNNIPVDVAWDMGAEVVIAVRTAPRTEEKVQETIGGIANRAITLMMRTMERRRLDRADVVIAPDLDGLTAADFRRSDEFAARGYQAAEALKETLLRYALDDVSWAAYRAGIEKRKTPSRKPVSFVEVKGVSDGAGALVARQLSRHVSTVPRAEDIEADINRVIGLGRYASATYSRRLIGESAGLAVDIRDKSYAPPFVRFALDLNNENRDVNLNVGSRITLMDVTGLGSEWRLDASLGSTLGIGTEFYQPIGGDRPVRGGAFLSPRASYTRTTENLYAGDDLVAIYGRQRAGAGLDIGWNSGGSTRLRAGYEAAYVRNITRVGDPLLPRSTGGEQAIRARFDYDALDAAHVAGRGARLSGAAQWYLKAPNAPQRFGSIEGSLQIAAPLRKGRIATFTADAGVSLGHAPPPLYQFGLGGPFRLGAFPPYAFRGPKYALGSVGYKAPLGHLPQLLGGQFYVQALAEAGSVFEDVSRARLKSSLSAGFSADTLLGPFFAGVSVSHEGETRAYFLVGRLVR